MGDKNTNKETELREVMWVCEWFSGSRKWLR